LILFRWSFVPAKYFRNAKWAGNFCFLPIFLRGKTEMVRTIVRFARSRKAATAIEYGLLAALIAVAGVGAFTGVGTQIKKTFNNSSTKMSAG
jgi:pilus assembly protein Flp/PilA